MPGPENGETPDVPQLEILDVAALEEAVESARRALRGRSTSERRPSNDGKELLH